MLAIKQRGTSQTNAELLRRIESAMLDFQMRTHTASEEERLTRLEPTLKTLALLADMVLQNQPIFGIEPWHAVAADPPLAQPGEMLLRLRTRSGAALPPYPFIMSFYELGLNADIDAILMLAALNQFENSDERQVSINISAHSFNDMNFLKTILSRLEQMRLKETDQIILEIHESAATLTGNRKALQLFRKFGIAFAIDDVGLSMNDVFRLSEFEDIADYIKLDRASVYCSPEKPNSLDHVMGLVRALLPRATIVAEGVRSASHACNLRQHHPAISYVQGMHLPDRAGFQKAWTMCE